jgi:hypothetical protein
MAILLLLANSIATRAQEPAQSSGEQVEDQVRAGEPYTFTVHLHDDQTLSNGQIMYQMFPLTNGGSIGTGWNICAITVPHKLDYVCKIETDKYVRGDREVVITNFRIQYPDKIVTLQVKPVRFRFLGAPPLIEVTETADVTVNLTQAQLLRRERARLQGQIADLKVAIAELEKSKSNNSDALAKLLRTNINSALTALQTTEREFESSSKEEQIPLSKIFFEDLRISYDAVLARIAHSFNRESSAFPPSFRLVFQENQAARPAYHPAEDTLHVLNRNQVAYETVADSLSLVFDLVVTSTPVGADILYFRQGDQPRKFQDPTNSTIHSLPKAIWTIRFEKEGYHTEQRDHDPFSEPNHVIHVDLQK